MRHAEVAAFIERTSGDRVGASAALLAHHWREAGERERAIASYLLAADHALRGWAKGEAVQLYGEALALIPDDEPRRRDVRLLRAHALMASGDYQQGADELDALIPQLEGRERLEATLARTKAASWLIDADGVRRFGHRSAALAEELGRPEWSAPALGYVSQIASMEGRPNEMIELGEQALSIWPRDHLPAEHAYQMELVALSQTRVGDFADADRNLRQALTLAEECHSIEASLRAGATLGLALVGLGRHTEAIARFDETIARGRDLELLPRFTARALNMSSAPMRDLHQLGEARRRNEEAIEFGRAAGFSLAWIQAGIDILEADILDGELGRADAAWASLWEQTEATEGFHQWLMAGRLLVARAQLDLGLGDPTTAASAAEGAIAHADATERPKQRVAARLILGEALVELGREDEGLAEMAAGVAIARQSTHPPTRWRADAAFGRALMRSGDEEAAAAFVLARSETVGNLRSGGWLNSDSSGTTGSTLNLLPASVPKRSSA